ncbi:MAG: PilN domain-containing protein [Betaproteobacteria bacterium]|nr:PilN domain-containing protein [Betaproteobacteria bacterium]
MIRINLLPHRERQREKRKKEFVTLTLLVALLGLVSAAAVSVGIAALDESQRARNLFIENANRKLDAEIKEIGQLRQEIEALTARQNAVESLERDRTIPVHLFDELVRRMPNGMTLRTMKQDGSRLFLTGLAQSNAQVSALYKTLANEAVWLERPELIEIRAGQGVPGQVPGREMKRVFEFSMIAGIRSRTEVERAEKKAAADAAAKSAPVAAPALKK